MSGHFKETHIPKLTLHWLKPRGFSDKHPNGCLAPESGAPILQAGINTIAYSKFLQDGNGFLIDLPQTNELLDSYQLDI